MTPAHWHILGAGAIGCLFAATLHRAGCPVTLVLKQADGSKTTPVRIERDNSCLELELPVAEVSAGCNISHLLVATKAYDVREAVLAAAHRFDEDCQILLLSNGMGFAETLRAELPQCSFYYGTTTHGAYRVDTRHICHAGDGLTRIGQPGSERPPGWFSQWQQAVPGSSWDTDIDQALWLKLAINCAINPLTALHGCTNGELARRPELAVQLSRLCEEIMRISAAAGYATVTRDLHEAVARVITATADNRSSMLQDVLAGRRTEIDFITGHLLSVGRHYAIAAPENQALFSKVSQLNR